MGFGHRVYRAEDPRARVLRRSAEELGAPRFEAALALEKAALKELRERRPDRPVETNVEFWAAIVLDFAEVPSHMFTSMFTCARTAGWCAHILEQKNTGRLVRPSARYIGPDPRKPDEVEGWDTIKTKTTTQVAPPERSPTPTARSRLRPGRRVRTPDREASRMSITIPADLLPADGRFGCGPSKVRPEALRRPGRRRRRAHGHLAPPGAGEGRWSAEVREGLSELFDLPDGYEVVLGNGGTTAFWDVATFGLIRDAQRSGTYGEFSAKFASGAAEAPFLADPVIATAEPGSLALPTAAGRRRRLRAGRTTRPRPA